MRRKERERKRLSLTLRPNINLHREVTNGKSTRRTDSASG